MKKQTAFVEKHVQPILDKNKKEGNGMVTDFEYYKIKMYYGVGIPIMVGGAIATLRGRDLSFKDRKSLTFLGSITSLFDDFFEEGTYSKEQVKNLVEDPGSFPVTNQREKLYVDLSLVALDAVTHHDKLDISKKLVEQAQWDSLLQLERSLSKKRQKEIMADKGGHSLVFFTNGMEDRVSTETEQCIYELGAVFQYANDIFDVYKDLQDGIYTYVNAADDINEVIKDFKIDVENMYANFRKLDYPKQNIERFVKLSNVAISQCLLCLEHYKELQESSGGVFKAENYSKKEIILDMEKPKNLIKAAWIYAGL